MAEVERDLQSSSGPISSLQQIAQVHVRTAHECLQGWRLYHIPGQPGPVPGHPHSFWMFRGNCPFQYVPFASGLVTGHHWNELGFVLCVPSLRVFLRIEKIPLNLLFSRRNSSSSFSLSSQKRCSDPFIIFMSLCWTLSSSISYFAVENSELNPKLQVWPHWG